MSTSAIDIRQYRAIDVRFEPTTLVVDLEDGRTLTVPLDWFPRLANGSPDERAHWRFIDEGAGVHWPDLDEDLSIQGLLDGRPSAERLESVQRWIAGREKR